jgi:hypothetical protein
MVAAAAAAGGKIIGGIGALKAGNANSKALKTQARGEMIAGAAEEARIREAARTAMGDQVAAQFGNGLEGGSGSALDALRESKIQAVLDTLEIRRGARIKSDELNARAKLEKRQGRFALASSILGAAGDVASMGSDWADARRGQSGGGSGGGGSGGGGSSTSSTGHWGG